MALSDAYATPSEYASAREKLSDDDTVEVARDLRAVSRMIDAVLGRPVGFGRDATAVARTFTALDPRDLDVDDLVSVSSVSVDGVAVSSADYDLWPYNAALKPEPWPYTTLRRITGGWPVGSKVSVTAIWGWPAVPAGIVAATIELTAILRMESPRATNRVNELDQVIGTSRAAQNILGELKHTYLRWQAVIA